MIRILILSVLFFTSNTLFAQKTYWKYEKTKAILTTAIDFEFIVNQIKEGDYVVFDEKNRDVLLYSNSDYLKKPLQFKKNELKTKIIGNRLKLLYRSGADDIYILSFLKTDEKDFIKNTQ